MIGIIPVIVFPLPPDLQTSEALPEIQDTCWRLLDQAARNGDSGWKRPVLGTSAPDGCRQRTVILRAIDLAERALLFHTDVRSPKVEQIQEDSRVSLLFYDHGLAVQLQIHGTASIHTSDSYADELWECSAASSLKGCLAPLAPGVSVSAPDSNLPPGMAGYMPERSEVEAGRRNFAVIRVLTQSMEWLRLCRDGNFRARFRYEDAALDSFEWLAP